MAQTETRRNFSGGEFGYDGWPNAKTRPTAEEIADPDKMLTLHQQWHAEIPSAQQVYYGADATRDYLHIIEALVDSSGYRMLASYETASGWGYGDFPQLERDMAGHPELFLLSYTVDPGGNGRAHCADVEPRAMVPKQIPYWYDNYAIWQNDLDIPYPWVYSSASDMSTCNAYIGSRKAVRNAAHYGFGMHICGPESCGYPQVQWTQWINTGAHGENIDRQVGILLPLRGAPPPPKEEDMATMEFVKNADGRTEVVSINADGKFSHRWERTAGQRDWSDWSVLDGPVKFKELIGTKRGDGAIEVLLKGVDGLHYISWQHGPNGSFENPVRRF